MRFAAITVRRGRLKGHVLFDRPVPHAVVTEFIAGAR
jgi:hypothetical protein